MKSEKIWKEGGCHCGKVRFRVFSDFKSVLLCNCSMCDKLAYLHLIVTRDEFELLRGVGEQTTYEFGTKTAKHLFCQTCGVKSYYVPRSHPDGFSVNIRCVDGVDLNKVKIDKFDGQRWEANAKKIQ